VFTEAFRAIKVSAWLLATIRENKVIGVTSTLSGEGKSTVAANLAALMADSGKRVILIDADLRNPTLAHSLSPRPTTGWLEVTGGKIDLAQATGWDPATGLALLPLVLNEAPVHSDEVLASREFRDLVDRLRQSYDYVIIDLPPIAPVVDVRAIDSFVFVVEWGSTRIKAVLRHLLAERELHDRLLGVVLNKANLKMLERAAGHLSERILPGAIVPGPVSVRASRCRDAAGAAPGAHAVHPRISAFPATCQ